MYGENGGLLRAELSALLRQHRIQQRIGGEGREARAGLGEGDGVAKQHAKPLP